MLLFHSLVRRTNIPSVVFLLLILSSVEGFSQSCSRESITAKYWQYRENLSKHFILVDRDPVNGCVHDGIGQSTTDPCKCSKSGYSLPATSIDMLRNGSHGMGERNPRPEDPQTFKDPDCDLAGPSPGSHWSPDGPKRHNALVVGSETPHQMGWYWVGLATEYQLLKENGQEEEEEGSGIF